MAKKFGKIVLGSTLIAGACAGAYAYLRNEGLLDNATSGARELAGKVRSDASGFAGKVRSDASERLGRTRTYFDLSGENEDQAEAAADKTPEETEVQTAADAGADDTETDADDSKADVEEEVAGTKAAEAIDEAPEPEDMTGFEPGIKAEPIDFSTARAVGSTVTEDFFDDEKSEQP